MSYRTRVSDSFARLSADQLVTMAGGVIAGLTNNPAFPAPTVDLKIVEIAVDKKTMDTHCLNGNYRQWNSSHGGIEILDKEDPFAVGLLAVF